MVTFINCGPHARTHKRTHAHTHDGQRTPVVCPRDTLRCHSTAIDCRLRRAAGAVARGVPNVHSPVTTFYSRHVGGFVRMYVRVRVYVRGESLCPHLTLPRIHRQIR